jgi:hypothetical protein
MNGLLLRQHELQDRLGRAGMATANRESRPGRWGSNALRHQGQHRTLDLGAASPQGVKASRDTVHRLAQPVLRLETRDRQVFKIPNRRREQKDGRRRVYRASNPLRVSKPYPVSIFRPSPDRYGRFALHPLLEKIEPRRSVRRPGPRRRGPGLPVALASPYLSQTRSRGATVDRVRVRPARMPSSAGCPTCRFASTNSGSARPWRRGGDRPHGPL